MSLQIEIITLHWDGAIHWYHLLMEEKAIHSTFVVNIMADDDLVMEKAITWTNDYWFHSCPYTLPGLNKLTRFNINPSMDK